MQRINKTFIFDFIYMVIMVIYMGQMTVSTRFSSINLSNIVPLLIPVILSLYQAKRHKIKFRNKNLSLIYWIYTLWVVAYILKEDQSFTERWKLLYFYVLVFFSYVQIKSLGRNLFILYEKVIVLFSIISLIGWGLCVLFPGMAHSLFCKFEETVYGNNFMYIFSYMDPKKGQVYYGNLVRNAGCSWEPGRFAIMLLPAIIANLYRKGLALHQNKNLLILLATLASTMSTTGISITLVIFLFFYIEKISLKNILIILIVIYPLTMFIMELDFMSNKIETQMAFQDDMETIEKSFERGSQTFLAGEHFYALDRIPSLFFEWQNFLKDPIIGYGNPIHSFFYNNISTNVTLTGGLIKLLATYGFILGIFLYVILFISSRKIALEFGGKRTLLFFIVILLSSISYPIFGVMVFNTFWLYGFFSDKKINNATF